MREQIAYHRRMAERLEALYQDCWQDGGAPAAAAAPNQTVPRARRLPSANPLDAWSADNIYEEMPWILLYSIAWNVSMTISAGIF